MEIAHARVKVIEEMEDADPKTDTDYVDDKRSSLRVRISVLHARLVDTINAIWEVLQLPLSYGAFQIYIILLIGAPLFSICAFGIYGLIACIIGQIPIAYLIIRESIRKDRSLPMADQFETSPAQWNETLDDFTAGNETD